jgi:hypothetical protein
MLRRIASWCYRRLHVDAGADVDEDVDEELARLIEEEPAGLRGS